MKKVTINEGSKKLRRELHLAISRGFWYGLFFYMGFNMFVQDYLGLEDYIAMVRDKWMELHWFVGLAIAGVAGTLRFGQLMRFDWLVNEIKIVEAMEQDE